MNKFKFLSKSKINDLPKTAGVYCFASPKPRGEGGFTVIYIGKAINIKDRVKNHFQQPSYRDNLFIGNVSKIGFFETGSEIEALILEANLIKKYQPKFNVIWKDDKNYFYVAVAQNEQKIPYIYITHQPNVKLQAKSYKLKADYIGPFIEGTALKKTLRFLRRAFPYYTLRGGSGQALKHPKNKCTYCHLDLCPGPRLFEARLDSPKGEAADLITDYKKNIKKLILILKGKRSAVLNSLRKEMKQLSKENKFEEAGKIRDRIYNLQQVMSHTHVISQDKMVAFLRAGKNATVILSNILGLEKPASKIECYDVSNIQGKSATSSMVVFTDGKPDKNQYRKFKIKMKNEPNDIAMLQETLQRRFSHPEWKYPEVILIDGGKAQLNIAIKVKEKIKEQFHRIVPMVISIAKGRQELFIENKKSPIPLKALPQEIYNLVKQLDDEAHRFAITYHKTLRKKNLLK